MEGEAAFLMMFSSDSLSFVKHSTNTLSCVSFLLLFFHPAFTHVKYCTFWNGAALRCFKITITVTSPCQYSLKLTSFLIIFHRVLHICRACHQYTFQMNGSRCATRNTRILFWNYVLKWVSCITCESSMQHANYDYDSAWSSYNPQCKISFFF